MASRAKLHIVVVVVAVLDEPWVIYGDGSALRSGLNNHAMSHPSLIPAGSKGGDNNPLGKKSCPSLLVLAFHSRKSFTHQPTIPDRMT